MVDSEPSGWCTDSAQDWSARTLSIQQNFRKFRLEFKNTSISRKHFRNILLKDLSVVSPAGLNSSHKMAFHSIYGNLSIPYLSTLLASEMKKCTRSVRPRKHRKLKPVFSVVWNAPWARILNTPSFVLFIFLFVLVSLLSNFQFFLVLVC